MNTKRKTLKMPVRYLMNAVLVALLFVGSFSPFMPSCCRAESSAHV